MGELNPDVSRRVGEQDWADSGTVLGWDTDEDLELSRAERRGGTPAPRPFPRHWTKFGIYEDGPTAWCSCGWRKRRSENPTVAGPEHVAQGGRRHRVRVFDRSLTRSWHPWIARCQDCSWYHEGWTVDHVVPDAEVHGDVTAGEELG